MAYTVVFATNAVRAESGSAATQPESVGIDPFYTGSLISPSPAESKAGALAFEPYVFYTINNGSYDAHGNVSTKPDKVTALQTLTLIKYGITDNLSIQVIPTTSENFDQHGFDSGSTIGDTSAEFEYLLMRQDKLAGKPAISASIGMDFPTGRYQHLDGPADGGSGNGNYRLRLGLLYQYLFFPTGEHPVRIRAYAAGAIPVASMGIHGFSAFGTDGGFNGTARSGDSASVGASVEYSFTQKVVFAFDVYQSFGTSDHVVGTDTGGLAVNTRGGSSGSTQLAPALEYNFNDNYGIIAGAAFSVAGYNSSTVIQPQIAFNFVF